MAAQSVDGTSADAGAEAVKVAGKLSEKIIRCLTRYSALAVIVGFGLLHAFIIGLYYRELLADSCEEAKLHLRIASGAVNHALATIDDPRQRAAMLEPTGILFLTLYDGAGSKVAHLGGPVAESDEVREALRVAIAGEPCVCPIIEGDYVAVDSSLHNTKALIVFVPVNRPGQPAFGPSSTRVLAAGYDNSASEKNLHGDLAVFAMQSGGMLTLLALVLILLTRHVVKAQERARLAAEEAVWVKNQFLSNVSHELRTPLNGIMGMVSLLKETKLDKEQAELANIAGRCADSLLELVENILLHIKFEVGRTKLMEEEFDLAVVLGLLADIFSTSAGTKGIDFKLKIDSEAPRKLFGDAEKLSRILTNLLDNAVKFTREGSVTLSVVFAGRSGDKVELEFIVSDTGVGIAPEKQKRLFEPFVQGDGSATREFGGLGMGLCLTRELVNAMKGRIRAKSVVGEGSSFLVLLPFTMANPQKGAKPTPAQPGLSPVGDAEQLLHPLDNLVGRVGGDRETALKLFRAFGIDLAEKPAAILMALEAGDEAGAVRLAAELKSAAGGMGATAVKSAALEVEAARVCGDAALLKDKAERLALVAGKVRAAVDSILARG